jgi:sugar/nucleoside kinase (ribokinase family)
MDMEMKQDGDKTYNLYQKDAFDFSKYDGLELVDTTGAGDSFTAAYAVAMLEGKASDKSLEFAN